MPASGLVRRAGASIGAAARGRLLGPAAIYICATAVNSAIPFVLLPFLTRWLGPTDFGVVGTFVAMVNVLGAVIGLSTHGLISVVYYRDGPDAMPSQTGAAVGVLATMTALLAILIFLFRDVLSLKTGIAVGWLWTVVVASSGQFMLLITLTVFQTRGQAFRYGAMQIGYGALLAAITIGLVAAHGMGYEGRLLAQAFAALVAAVVGLALLTASAGVSWNPRHWPVREALAFGLPLIPHAFGAVAMASVDRFALGSVVGQRAVGQYYLGIQLSSMLVVLATALNQAWLPWLYERLARNDDETRAAVVRSTWMVFALIALGAACLALGAPLIVRLITGGGFEPTVLLLRLQAPAFAFNAMYFFVAAYLFYEKRTGLLASVTLTAALIQATLSFGLARLWGAPGVALATLISMALYFSAVWAAAHHVHPMPWFSALIRRPPGPGPTSG